VSEAHETSATVGPEAADLRVDQFVSEVMHLFPRSQLHHRDARFWVNDVEAKPSRRVHDGDSVRVLYRDLEQPDIEPEPITLNVLYEDDRVIVIDKPSGMVVHPAAGNWSGTLAQGLLHRLGREARDPGGERIRPGIVHRLDKDTSGVLIAAKSPEALETLSRQFRDRALEKQYLAIVKGVPPGSGVIDTLIARDPHNRKRFAVAVDRGRRAVTEYRVLKSYGAYSLVVLKPETGRTHQLRVHMAHLAAPVLGDPVYARRDTRFPDVPLMLHAYRLRITLPNETSPRTFTARLPNRFREVLRQLGDQPAAENRPR
jgi:23S rRNA pseudouridine1911/1915/1917 synthase